MEGSFSLTGSAPSELPEAAGADNELPRNIGRYVIRRLLGRGGFGTVYEAHDPELNRDIAIKVPRRDLWQSDSGAELFQHEARAAAQLKHPGIVAIYDVGRAADGGLFVVMELVAGQSLDKVLKAGPLSPRRAAEIMVPVAEAVHYAHRHGGLVHRDLKPANILLDESGKPHVADFGLALHESQLRGQPSHITGTLSYMAPEQVRGEVRHLDGRCDIWGLGVILYEMLSGRLPFAGKDFLELRDEIERREPRPLGQIDDSIPAALDRVVNRCLRKNIADRYSTAAELAADLENFLSPAPGAAPAAPGYSVDRPQSAMGSFPARVMRTVRATLQVGPLGCSMAIVVACLVLAIGAWATGLRFHRMNSAAHDSIVEHQRETMLVPRAKGPTEPPEDHKAVRFGSSTSGE